MTRTTTRIAAALAAATFAAAGVACTGADGTDADGTEDPVILEPGEEQGETLLPETPNEVEGTEG